MITFNMSLKQYIFLNVSTHALHLNEPFGVNMEHLCALFKEINEKQNPEDPRGWKEIPEESKDPQIVNPGVSKVQIGRGTSGFGVFKEPLAIPSHESMYSWWSPFILYLPLPLGYGIQWFFYLLININLKNFPYHFQ